MAARFLICFVFWFSVIVLKTFHFCKRLLGATKWLWIQRACRVFLVQCSCMSTLDYQQCRYQNSYFNFLTF